MSLSLKVILFRIIATLMSMGLINLHWRCVLFELIFRYGFIKIPDLSLKRWRRKRQTSICPVNVPELGQNRVDVELVMVIDCGTFTKIHGGHVPGSLTSTQFLDHYVLWQELTYF